MGSTASQFLCNKNVFPEGPLFLTKPVMLKLNAC